MKKMRINGKEDDVTESERACLLLLSTASGRVGRLLVNGDGVSDHLRPSLIADGVFRGSDTNLIVLAS